MTASSRGEAEIGRIGWSAGCEALEAGELTWAFAFDEKGRSRVVTYA